MSRYRLASVTSTPPKPVPSLHDPLVIAGGLAGLACLSIVLFASQAAWTAWFTHPLLLERIGEIPTETVQGVRLLFTVAPVAALAWILAPWLLRWFDRGSPIPRFPSFPPPPTFATKSMVVLLTVLAIVPRLIRIEESLWYDEIAAMSSFSIHGPGPALGNYYALSNHVLHSALASLVIDANGGANELVLRVPALLAGIACVPAMFGLARTVDGDRFGLIAAAVMALMPVAVLESVDARGYSLMMLFTILTTTQVVRISDGHRSGALWYAAFATLGCWSHFAFAFVPLGHALLAISWLFRRHRRGPGLRLAVGLGLGGVTTLLVLAPVLPSFFLIRGEFVAVDGDEPSLFGIEARKAVLQLGGSWYLWASLPGLALALLGGTESSRWPRLRIATFASVAGGLVTGVILLAGDGWVYARFLLFLVPGAVLLVAAGIRALAYLPQRSEPAYVAALILAIGWCTALAVRPPRQPIRDAIEALAAPAAGRSVWSIGLGDDVADYYGSALDLRLQHAGNLGARLDAAALADGPDHAVVLYPDLVTESTRALLETAGFRTTDRFEGWLDWGHGDVELLTRPTR